MKSIYAALLSAVFLLSLSPAFAQDGEAPTNQDLLRRIKSNEELLEAQEEAIENLKTKTEIEIDNLKTLSQQQANLIATLTNNLETVTMVAARLEKALPTDGSLWLKGKKVIDAGGGWHRSYGNTGWYNGTHGGGWHMTDSNWIRSYGNKNVYVNKMLRADDGFQVDGKKVIDPDAGWHRSYGDTGWYNGTHGGGWHMIDRWIRSYGNKDVYVNKMVRADNGFQVDAKQIIDGSGKVLVSPQYSQEYTWKQGQNAVKMQKTSQYACYLMSVAGDFEGGGEKVRVYSSGGWWYLGGHSLQNDVHGTARCVTFR